MTITALGGVCAPLVFETYTSSWLVDRPAWVETPVALRDVASERARLAAISDDIERCRRGESPVYKLLPPPRIKWPTFTATRGGIRFILPVPPVDGDVFSITQTITT